MNIRIVFIPIGLLLTPLFTHAQAWKWAKSLGTPNTSTNVQTIRPYTDAKVLVCGSFAAPVLALGSHSLNNAGQDDGFVAIADNAGQYAWAASFGGSDRDFVVDAAAAPNGDFVAVGNFNSISLSIGGVNLFNSGETDGFVVKYKQDKTLAWAHKIGTADIEEVKSVVLDTDGNAYVSGHVQEKFTLNTLHVFLRKYDAAGNLVWEKKGLAQVGYMQATALTLDDDQNIYLGGWVVGTAVFEGTNLISNDGYAAFIVKYAPSGVLLDTSLDLDLGQYNDLQTYNNHIYACAEKVNWGFGWGWPLSDSKIFVLKFDSDLNTVWEKFAGGDSAAYSRDIAKSISVDDLGNAYVTGYFFSDTLRFAGQALPNLFHINYFYPQIFVFKYAPSGEELWAKSFGDVHSDEGTGIHAFGDDQFFLAGNFESDPVIFGNYDLHNTSTLDSMYVHLRPSRYVRKTMGFLAVFDKNASSVDPEPAFQQVTLFPNPATDHINLRLKSPTQSPITLYISTPDGSMLLQSEHSGQAADIREDLGNLPPGLYFLTLRTERGLFSCKFVKGG